jgi:transcriptional repressor NrdR
VEEVPLLIVKKDGRREPFDRQKLMKGMMAACQKRPVSLTKLEEASGDIQAKLLESPDREIQSRHLGELVMDALKGLDSVAYVRFASVYRDFKDLPDFVKALESLMTSPGPTALHASPAYMPSVERDVVPETNKPIQQKPAGPSESTVPRTTPLFPDVGSMPLASSKRRKGK